MTSPFIGRRRSHYDRGRTSMVPDGNRNVRLVQAKRPGRCFLCPFPIMRGQWLLLHNASGHWVHTGCIAREAEERAASSE